MFLKNKIHRPHWHLTDPDEQECDTYSIFILSLFSILSFTGATKEKDSFTRSEIISGSPWTKSALTLGGKYQKWRSARMKMADS